METNLAMFSSSYSVHYIPAPGLSRRNKQQKAFFMHILLLDWLIINAMITNSSELDILSELEGFLCFNESCF